MREGVFGRVLLLGTDKERDDDGEEGSKVEEDESSRHLCERFGPDRLRGKWTVSILNRMLRLPVSATYVHHAVHDEKRHEEKVGLPLAGDETPVGGEGDLRAIVHMSARIAIRVHGRRTAAKIICARPNCNRDRRSGQLSERGASISRWPTSVDATPAT